MLGFLWTMLNPVIMTAVYTVVFSTIFRFGTEDFVIYFFSAITNPMYHFVECFRCPIYNRPFPSFGITAMSVLIALVTLAVGYKVF
jgi:ABC-type polysaccharide/polyol phosphate export permease